MAVRMMIMPLMRFMLVIMIVTVMFSDSAVLMCGHNLFSN
jgi:hypothetical protein